MAISRRTWIAASTTITAAAATTTFVTTRPRRPASILVLGGSKFVGRAFVEAALARGHHLTLFNRGRTNPGLFPAAEQLIGDRNGDLTALQGRTWDAALDTSAVHPDPVRATCELLQSSVQRYVYISTTAVYDGGDEPWDETTPRQKPGRERYGARKVACEDEVTHWFPGRNLLPRAAPLVGPHDSLHRFLRWPLRARQGGELLAPASPEHRVPLVDVRDLGQWLVHAIEAELVGAFNVAGPQRTMGELLNLATARSYAVTNPTWIPEPWLRAHKVAFDSLPNLGEPGYRSIRSDRAAAEGLTYRDLATTMDDTLAWWDSEDDRPTELKGLSLAREHELLATWHAERPTR